MSDGEDLRQAITEITDRTGQAWREHVSNTFQEIDYMQRGLEGIDTS